MTIRARIGTIVVSGKTPEDAEVIFRILPTIARLSRAAVRKMSRRKRTA